MAGNRHAVVGTKEGSLDVLDVGSGEVVTSLPAHKGAIWAVTPLPDNSGLITGSADHEAKFWEWQVGTSASADMFCTSLRPRGTLTTINEETQTKLGRRF